MGLEPEPPDYKSAALPIELHQHEVSYILFEKLLQAFFSILQTFVPLSKSCIYI